MQKNRSIRDQFLDDFKVLAYRYRAINVWSDFIVMFACALSRMDKSHFDEREALYLKTIKKYRKKEQEIFPKLAAYVIEALDENSEQDFLGELYMSLGLGDGAHGQFFTPYHMCEFMAEVLMPEESYMEIAKRGLKYGESISLNDPCCGAGATLIAGINVARKRLDKLDYNYQECLLVVGQDIDMIAALMCYIQISLLGVRGYVKVGNSLTDPIAPNDSKKNYWYTPMYMREKMMNDQLRKIFGADEDLITPIAGVMQ
ncbi:MAG: N-6 DNA methylase [Lachnospiraceae bacterium]|nr:N-6 DNA methylase [Lachnospiraceae bacterium]